MGYVVRTDNLLLLLLPVSPRGTRAELSGYFGYAGRNIGVPNSSVGIVEPYRADEYTNKHGLSFVVRQKWPPKFGQCCKVGSALMRGA